MAAECAEVGPKEPLTREKLSPVIAVLKAEDTEDGLKKARQMVEFNGLGHSAAIHTKDEALAKRFGTEIKAMRIIWNSPSTFGGIGDVYNAFIPSLTLGCGSYGQGYRHKCAFQFLRRVAVVLPLFGNGCEWTKRGKLKLG